MSNISQVLTEAAQTVLQGQTAGSLLGFIVIAYTGFVLSLVLDFYSSGEAIQQFNLAYFWKDNLARIIQAFVIIPFLVVFATPIFDVTITVTSAFTFGFAVDKFIETLKDRRKKQLRNKENTNE